MPATPPAGPNPRVWNRRLHRWGAATIAVPFGVVIATGLLLQVKKQVDWVQPPERRTEARVPQVPFERILEQSRAVPEAAIVTWDDIDRLDVRPGKGMLKVIARSGWELQLDIATGALLQVAYRRSDFIETLHDMSWIHDSAKLWLGVPMGLIVLGLWGTGLYLWLVHWRGRRRSRLAVEGSRPTRI